MGFSNICKSLLSISMYMTFEALIGGVAEDSRLLGCATVLLDAWFLVLRKIIGPSQHLQPLTQ
jgi:hypothetical protein